MYSEAEIGRMEQLVPDIIGLEARELVNYNFEIIDQFDQQLETEGYVTNIWKPLKLEPDHLMAGGEVDVRQTATEIACTTLGLLHKHLGGFGDAILNIAPDCTVRYYTVTRDDFKTYYVSEIYAPTNTGLRTGITAQLVSHMPIAYENVLRNRP